MCKQKNTDIEKNIDPWLTAEMLNINPEEEIDEASAQMIAYEQMEDLSDLTEEEKAPIVDVHYYEFCNSVEKFRSYEEEHPHKIIDEVCRETYDKLNNAVTDEEMMIITMEAEDYIINFYNIIIL